MVLTAEQELHVQFLYFETACCVEMIVRHTKHSAATINRVIMRPRKACLVRDRNTRPPFPTQGGVTQQFTYGGYL